MSDKKRKAESHTITVCPITNLPINEKLIKKLKSSQNVTEKTMSNILQHKLGWPPERIKKTWNKDTLIQEYYAALSMKLAQQEAASSPAARSPQSIAGSRMSSSPGQGSAPVAVSRSALKSVRGRPSTSSTAASSSPALPGPPGRRGSGASEVHSPVHASRAAEPPRHASQRTSAMAKTSKEIKKGGSCLGFTIRMFVILVAAMALVVYSVHGFEGGKQKLLAGAQGNYVENFKGLAMSTKDGFIKLLMDTFYTPFSDHVKKLYAKLNEVAAKTKAPAAPAPPKDGLVVNAKKEEKKKPAAPSPTVTVTKLEAAKDEAEKTKQYAERRKVAEEAERKKAAEEKQKAAAREAEAAEQRALEQKRKEEEAKAAAIAKQKRDEEERKVHQARLAEKVAAKKKAEEDRAQQDAAAKKAEEERAQQEAAAQQHAAAVPPPPAAGGGSDAETIHAESCETFDVYDCDVKYPQQFDACRAKKDACPSREV